MYIDIHTHLAYNKIYPFDYLSGMLDGMNKPLDKGQFSSLMKFFLNDQFGKKFIKQMNDAKVDKSVLLIIDGGVKLNEASLTIEEIHLLHYEVLKLYPDRFIVFAGIDPRRGKIGFELFKKSIFEYGFKGLKLYPPMGYAMDSPLLTKYYEICNQYRLPVLIHTGPSLASLENHFANPIFIQNIASIYPNINFILAHAGYRLSDPIIQSVLKLPNVYADIAGFQSFFDKKDLVNMQNLELIFDNNFNKKILFGTDWPLFNLFSPLDKHVQIIKDVFEKIFSYNDKIKLDNILFNNAKEVLKSVLQ